MKEGMAGSKEGQASSAKAPPVPMKESRIKEFEISKSTIRNSIPVKNPEKKKEGGHR